MQLTGEKEASVICPACRTPAPATARHCPNCGARLNAATQPSGSVPAPYPGTSSAQPPALAPLAAGTILQGRYHIVRVLGTGAFGRVYLADDTQDPDTPQVAMKELLDTQVQPPEDKREAIAWFKREVSVLLTLEHPGIPTIHGYWTARAASGPFYLAMDYIPGRTLEAALHEAGGRIPWRQVVEWGIALCDVLTYLHERTPPFVFRDFKLPNVMLDSRTNRPVLIDFGIARQLASESGTAIGTWGYVPFEQALGNAEPRSDLYALGATLHASRIHAVAILTNAP
jgi:eukaryotic-like serine/threonine-protein kinase